MISTDDTPILIQLNRGRGSPFAFARMYSTPMANGLGGFPGATRMSSRRVATISALFVLVTASITSAIIATVAIRDTLVILVIPATQVTLASLAIPRPRLVPRTFNSSGRSDLCGYASRTSLREDSLINPSKERGPSYRTGASVGSGSSVIRFGRLHWEP